MADIIDFPHDQDITPAPEWMDNNKDAFERLLAVGFDEDGDVRIGSNGLTVMECVYLLEYAKRDLMDRFE